MSILLVESHYRSRPWLKALGMTQLDKIHIISVNKGELRFFKELLPDTKIEITKLWGHEHLNETLVTISKNLEEFSKKYSIDFSWIVQTDRTLRKKKRSLQLSYLHRITVLLEKVFLTNPPNLVFMECTWAHEFITAQLASTLGIPVLCPGPLRFINNRILFFKGLSRKDYYLRDTGQSQTQAPPLTVRPFEQKPEEYDLLSKRNAFTFSKVRTLIRLCRDWAAGYRNPFIQPSISSEIYRKIKSLFRFYFIKLSTVLRGSGMPTGNYVLLGLHVQPEASIDVVGYRFRDQIRFAEMIAECLPINFTLVVKEHPHAIGSRPFGFYKRLLNIKNIRVVTFANSSENLLQRASLVITVAGTMSLEAACLGVKAVTAEEMFFSKALPLPSLPDSLLDLKLRIAQLLELHVDKQEYEKKINVMIAELMPHTYPGKTSAPNQDPYAMGSENIAHLRYAFSEVIDKIHE